MTSHVKSSAAVTERGKRAVTQSLAVLCVLAWPVSWGPAAQFPLQNKPSSEARERIRFQATDFENDLPVPGAEVSLAYLQEKGTHEVRKEIVVKTDGLAEFPKLEAYKLAVSVTAKGYRFYWRWRANSTEGLTRIRLERWAKSPK
jgi:hypothetical protein